MKDNLINLIDKAVLDLKPFLEYKLPTLKDQLIADREYIRALCNLRGIHPQPYIIYYCDKVEEYGKLIESQ